MTAIYIYDIVHADMREAKPNHQPETKANSTTKTAARKIVADLPEFCEFAAREAKIWENHGKCRIYFGRKYVELFDDGTADVGSNPYAVSEIVGRYCDVR